MPATKNTPSMHPLRRRNVTTSMLGLKQNKKESPPKTKQKTTTTTTKNQPQNKKKNGHIHKKFHPKW